MSTFKTINIGIVLSAGFRAADLIEMDAVFRIHPRNKVFFLAEKTGLVKGQNGFGITAEKSFSNCPQLDVLIIGETASNQIKDVVLLDFLKRIIPNVKFVIAVSNGVKTLHTAGVLDTQTVTTNAATMKSLRNTRLNVIEERRCVIDGKFITAGPSSGAIEAAFAVLRKLRGEWLTKLVAFNLEYHADVQYPVNEGNRVEIPPLPRPLKIGVFAAPDIYVPDVMGAVDVFSAIPNAEIYYVGYEKGYSKSIASLGPTITTNMTLAECPELDVLIVGATHPRYIKDVKLLDFIRRQEQSTQAIISVCAGTFVIGAAGLLEGKRAATNYHQTGDLQRVGACFNGNEVEVDGKYFSAGPAVGSYQVGLKAVEKLIGEQWAQYIEHEVLEFAPNVIEGARLTDVSPSVLRVTNIASFFLRKIFRPAIAKGYNSKQLKVQTTHF